MWIVIQVYWKGGNSMCEMFDTDIQMETFCKQHLRDYMDEASDRSVYYFQEEIEEWDLDTLISKIKELSHKVTRHAASYKIKYIIKTDNAEMIYSMSNDY